MAWTPVVVDLEGRNRAFVRSWESIELTQRINDGCEALIALPTLASSATEILIAERAIKLYDDDGNLRLHGQIWEPLEINQDNLSVVVRDPHAALSWRRVRDAVDYVATDAGDIVEARLDAQNARAATHLQVGSVAPSVVRDRSYPVGKLERELLDQLAEASQGFFYRVDPVDDVPGILSELTLLYPDPGVSRAGARFEYGEGTLSNLEGFRVVYKLPRNRIDATSGETDGTRLSAVIKSDTSIAQYGLFEDEIAFSDVLALPELEQYAAGLMIPAPPKTIEITPGPEAPLLFTDFVAGDFVRIYIKHGPLDLIAWARVTEAKIVIDKNGDVSLSSITVDTAEGQNPDEKPEDMFRTLLDDHRRRLEALERRVANPTLDDVGGDEGTDEPAGGGTTPDEPDEPTAPPPTTPPPTPSVSVSAEGVNYRNPNGSVLRGVIITAQVDTGGLSGTVTFQAAGFTHTISTSGGQHQIFFPDGAGNSGTAIATVQTAGGTAQGSAGYTVPVHTQE